MNNEEIVRRLRYIEEIGQEKIILQGQDGVILRGVNHLVTELREEIEGLSPVGDHGYRDSLREKG